MSVSIAGLLVVSQLKFTEEHTFVLPVCCGKTWRLYISTADFAAKFVNLTDLRNNGSMPYSLMNRLSRHVVREGHFFVNCLFQRS